MRLTGLPSMQRDLELTTQLNFHSSFLSFACSTLIAIYVTVLYANLQSYFLYLSLYLNLLTLHSNSSTKLFYNFLLLVYVSVLVFPHPNTAEYFACFLLYMCWGDNSSKIPYCCS